MKANRYSAWLNEMKRVNAMSADEKARHEQALREHTEKVHAEFSSVKWAHSKRGSNPQADFPVSENIEEAQMGE